MTPTTPEKHTFEAEVQQLLDIVIHSLYTDKEIFLRELVSNAADSLEKLRHLQLTEKEIFDDTLELEINISSDESAGTITIWDFGIGMTRDELNKNLGTIAHSGSQAFIEALKESKGGGDMSNQLIGQFGVGFYSAFMVAATVKVYTHSWHNDAEHLLWISDGLGSYEIESSEGQRRGCKIVVQFKEEDKEFANTDRIKGILTRYSSFVPFPINLNGEQINKIDALWLRSKNDIKDEEYNEFYKFQANAFDEPLMRLHFQADAPLSINALLFVPKMNNERFGFSREESGISLYCHKVMIDSKPDGLLPEWLRFIKGVVDSDDLPLNVSRERMQDTALIDKLNRVLTKRFLKFLADEAKKNPQAYENFYKNFDTFLKEGISTDYTHRESLAHLLRYESSLTDPGTSTSFVDYVSRMKEDQKEIYYIFAPNRQTIENGPYLEAFKTRGIEVIYAYDGMDEFVMGHLAEFDGKKIVAADQAEIEADDPNASSEALSDADATALCEWFTTTLDNRADGVSASKRLVDSPAIAINADQTMTPTMRRIMKAMNQNDHSAPKVKLELNTSHQLIKNLAVIRSNDADTAKMIAEQIFDNAMIAAGFLEDPRSMVGRVYDILQRMSEK